MGSAQAPETRPLRALVTGAARPGSIGQAIVARLEKAGMIVETLDKLPRPNWPDERIVRGIKALDPWALADKFGDTLESIYEAVGEYLFKFEDADGCLVVVDTLAEWFVIVPIEE